MKIQYCSDLHLEFASNSQFLKKNPLVPTGEILLLAGDITTFSNQRKHDYFFDYVSKNFKAVYWVPGNHEYYGYDLVDKCGSFCEQIRENIFLLNNEIIHLDGIELIFSTMWSAISPANHWTVQQSVSDFHVIKYNEQRFNPNHFNQLHEQSRDFLRSTLRVVKDRSRTVVVTHHVPTFLNYPPQYAGDPLNEAFGVELFDLIEEVGPSFWIYGHHHRNIAPFMVGQTCLITNQLGYVHYNEHKDFNKNSFIEL